MNEAKLLKLNYVHNLISAGSFMVTISAMTLIHLGLTAMFTTPYKKKKEKSTLWDSYTVNTSACLVQCIHGVAL